MDLNSINRNQTTFLRTLQESASAGKRSDMESSCDYDNTVFVTVNPGEKVVVTAIPETHSATATIDSLRRDLDKYMKRIGELKMENAQLTRQAVRLTAEFNDQKALADKVIQKNSDLEHRVVGLNLKLANQTASGVLDPGRVFVQKGPDVGGGPTGRVYRVKANGVEIVEYSHFNQFADAVYFANGENKKR
jgi:hypothetical protein